MDLNQPIQYLPKIGPAHQRKLNKLGIKTLRDLLWHFPQRYEDFSKICPIAKVKINQKCCLSGKILEINSQRTWKKRLSITEAVIQDKTGAIKAIWFNQPYLSRTLKAGDMVCLSGKVVLGRDGLVLSSPVYEKIWPSKESIHTNRLAPIYPETAGLSSRWLRYILYPLLQQWQRQLVEFLPPAVIKEHQLMPLAKAIWQIHFPDSLSKAEQARKRFSFEGLFLVELAVLQQKFKLAKEKAPGLALDVKLMQKFVKTLPFRLTDAQRKCVWQILKDTEKPRPMSRLLEGDVGSGKTVVAVMAALNAVKAGWQTAFMAPTEILAKQHFNEVSKLLQPFRVKIALLTGKQDKIISQKLGYQTKAGFRPEILEISRQKILEKAKKGEVDMLIGTHALIQDKVKFGKLALAIIDEQHRFGVKQRAKLIAKKRKEKTFLPHLLSMTATPIPRTLALTVYGDLDLSLLDELPKGRKEIKTEAVAPAGRKKTYQFIQGQVKKGCQVFVICPRIEPAKKQDRDGDIPVPIPSPWSEVKAVKEEYEKLSKKVFPDLKIEMLHGKLKAKEKEKIMERFKAGKFDILVATSVVEVGVDIPGATVMLIEGADRFGLAQLYQFRGRVGRADKQSYCFLFTDSPSRTTRARLQAIIKAKNGFELAEKDLEIRGPGSLTGIKQWGLPDLTMANLTDLKLVESARETAKQILLESPALKKYPALQARVSEFSQQIHFE